MSLCSFCTMKYPHGKLAAHLKKCKLNPAKPMSAEQLDRLHEQQYGNTNLEN